MVPVKVSRKEIENIAKVWTRNGVSLIVSDIGIDFATDVSNLVLANFIKQCQLEAAQQAKAAATPKVQIVEE